MHLEQNNISVPGGKKFSELWITNWIIWKKLSRWNKLKKETNEKNESEF